MIAKTIVGLDGELSRVFECDTIEHAGKLWLVPEWLEAPELRVRRPARIVCLSSLPHKMISETPRHYALERSIPRSVLEGRAPPEVARQYEVYEEPDIVLHDDKQRPT